ncbi:MAG: flagellar brake protein [Betaproteobacteria bacterium]|nr:flagellar brake protein [Betaproteobacteria bacterium]
MATNQVPGAKREGQITYSSTEISRILALFTAQRVPISAHLRAAELFFVSRLRHVDPQGQYILIDPSTNDDANAALLIRPRCTFYAATGQSLMEMSPRFGSSFRKCSSISTNATIFVRKSHRKFPCVARPTPAGCSPLTAA